MGTVRNRLATATKRRMAVESLQPGIMEDELLGVASTAELTERTNVPSLRENMRGEARHWVAVRMGVREKKIEWWILEMDMVDGGAELDFDF